ncbi:MULTISPECIES: hypothetical protein [unclassified Enterococcus]|uniref:hypothetical protein n=1 Tax=unclassified Enterococcus TaxID=2608891 RepID=UPI0015547F58|nr:MULTISPECIES: hypothetical protein [unclassified Enterococcus]MBS7578310.1 hypothetical protein [Enterococcus sp. MMGLQ5-2]MBS7585479.1 hypothetical protein [Enterococcus sp. MMGLQ5-1]NPD13336.1 hypothetical protein [Enterococcus sp. MMGLQ5-1]NPD38141.1 hypothetical protein [Enterococcus sp. MMGLQ5-2]
MKQQLTYRDLFIELKEKHGITTSAMFHHDLNETISREKYDSTIELMLKMFNSVEIKVERTE